MNETYTLKEIHELLKSQAFKNFEVKLTVFSDGSGSYVDCNGTEHVFDYFTDFEMIWQLEIER